MFAYLLLLIAVFIWVLSMAVYLIYKIQNCLQPVIKKKVLLWLISLLFIALLVLLCQIDLVNVLIVYVHLFAFFLLAELVLFFIRKKTHKPSKPYISLLTGVVLTALYLSAGYYWAHHVVETDYTLSTTKQMETENFRIAHISDSHIGTTFDGETFTKYLERIDETHPDILVITGDFVDDSTTYQDMSKSCLALGNLQTTYGIFFVYGNHDKGYSNYRDFDDAILRKELTKNHISILEDSIVQISDNMVIVGRQDAQVSDRKPATDLTKDIDKNKYIILLDHQPNDFTNEAAAKADLVLCGHTHGGQLIPLGQLGLLLKENDFVYGKKTIDSSTFIVSSGISDWAIHFKTGCQSEYGIIDIKPASK